jgi:hypothetical protein
VEAGKTYYIEVAVSAGAKFKVRLVDGATGANRVRKLHLEENR